MSATRPVYPLQPYTPMFKIIVVGDENTGKSSLLNCFCHNQFDMDQPSTIGIDFYNKGVTLVNNNVSQNRVKLQIWDTAGQERYRAITKSYYRNSDCVLICYDTTNVRSFENVRQWLHGISACISEEKLQAIPVFLVETKYDLVQTRVSDDTPASTGVATTAQLACLVKQHKLAGVFKCSARTGYNVNALFHTISTRLLLASTRHELCTCGGSDASPLLPLNNPDCVGQGRQSCAVCIKVMPPQAARSPIRLSRLDKYNREEMSGPTFNCRSCIL
jgi:small GTP-binding protein